MEKPDITRDMVRTLLDEKYIKVFDLQYAPGRHYFDATRRSLEDLTAVKSEAEFRHLLPDAVTCIVIVRTPHHKPRLLLSYEFRYPTGQFLLSPPAGLIDAGDHDQVSRLLSSGPEGTPDKEKHLKALDKAHEMVLLETARREIHEETGLEIGDSDRLYVVSPLVFSTPGMTDESNALVCAVVHLADLSGLTQSGAVGSECFDGFQLLTRKKARRLLESGRDEHGHFYSVYTYACLSYFVSEEWKNPKKFRTEVSHA